MANTEVETGLQLFMRLSTRPNIENIYPNLIQDGPSPYQVIEITGDSSTGKTFLITEIIANCILPEEIKNFETGGKNAAVILINTDHHFRILKLTEILKYKLKEFNNEYYVLSNEEITTIIKDSLKNLIILNCYESQELYITFHKLDNILSNNDKISLIVLDSISAFYWADRLTGGIKKISIYQKTILKLLQIITKDYKIVIMFTKTISSDSEDVFEECYKEPTLEKINYRIYLEEVLHNIQSFTASSTNPDNKTIRKYYNINEIIEWCN